MFDKFINYVKVGFKATNTNLKIIFFYIIIMLLSLLIIGIGIGINYYVITYLSPEYFEIVELSDLFNSDAIPFTILLGFVNILLLLLTVVISFTFNTGVKGAIFEYFSNEVEITFGSVLNKVKQYFLRSIQVNFSISGVFLFLLLILIGLGILLMMPVIQDSSFPDENAPIFFLMLFGIMCLVFIQLGITIILSYWQKVSDVILVIKDLSWLDALKEGVTLLKSKWKYFLMFLAFSFVISVIIQVILRVVSIPFYILMIIPLVGMLFYFIMYVVWIISIQYGTLLTTMIFIQMMGELTNTLDTTKVLERLYGSKLEPPTKESVLNNENEND
ncbi:hypothetical protein KAU33_04665 [Candidatus Dependentiae bacterium]|nr:hypothetical protein [Candidatus Dependentiae bacterium]